MPRVAPEVVAVLDKLTSAETAAFDKVLLAESRQGYGAEHAHTPEFQMTLLKNVMCCRMGNLGTLVGRYFDGPIFEI